ncbi:LCP family protein [Candidatus Dojkabacteria bacterium]|uniref:LCP family protein n=1 Tax=Candidatus Dojkabacteria bacterium TaxID=2099670 RepID=A0A952AJ99_9BACT|nr:LCP family protein [Candidatus Dojkabacteria bacterium]
MLKKLKQKLTSSRNQIVRQSKRGRQKKSKSLTGKKGSTISTRLRQNRIISIIYKPKLIIAVFLLLLILAFAPYVKAFYDFSPKREVSDKGEPGQVEWNGVNRIITLIVGIDQFSDEHRFVDAIGLLVVDPQRSELGIFMISPDIEVYVPGLNKNSNLRTILNNKDSKGNEIEILVRSVESLMAVKIDRYLLTNTKGFSEVGRYFDPVSLDLRYDLNDEDVSDTKGRNISWSKGRITIYQDQFVGFLAANEYGNDSQLARQSRFLAEFAANLDSLRTLANIPQILQAIEDNVYTNISKNEFFTLARHLWAIRRDQVKLAYTQSASLLPLESKGLYSRYSPLTESIDRDMSSIMFNFNLAKEQARIEVFNASGIRGMANSRARWITNSGGRVVQIGNARNITEQTTVYVANPEKYPVTIFEIERIFGKNLVYATSPYEEKHIGDIIIVIGESVVR